MKRTNSTPSPRAAWRAAWLSYFLPPGFSGLLIVCSVLAAPSQAETLLETATLGASGPLAPDNYVVSDVQFLGVRFEVTSTVTTSSIGGHFATDGFPTGNGKFFGGIVALTSAADLPDSIELSTPDLLGTTLLTFPNPSADVSAPLSVTLQPGHYALVFGSGLFGATGYGGAKTNNNPVGSSSWISTPNAPQMPWANTNPLGLFDGLRFFVNAVPEPCTSTLTALGLFGALAGSRVRRARQAAGSKRAASAAASLALLVLTPPCAVANFSGSDDFSAPSTSWGADSTGGAGQFQLDDGFLKFITVAPPTGNDQAQRSWTANAGDYAADWSVRIDVAIGDFAMTTNQFASIDILVQNLADIPNDFVRLVLRRDGVNARYVYADAYSNGASDPEAVFVPTLDTAITLGLSYDSAARTISAGYDVDGPVNGFLFQRILAAHIESGASDWNMNPADQFAAKIVGQTQELGVALGHITIDNFVAAPEQLAMVPEPAGAILALLGVASLRQLMRRTRRSRSFPPCTTAHQANPSGIRPRMTILRLTAIVAALLAASGALVNSCDAETLYETATLGPTGVTPTWAIYRDQFLGVRFSVSTPVTTATIGGHFATTTNDGNKFFGAIVALTGAEDFPDSDDLSSADVLGATLLTWPNPSADVSAPLSVTLAPGHYALVFGGGLFGADNNRGGGLVVGNPPIGSPSLIAHNPPPENWRNTDLAGGSDVRLFVTSVPEPSTISLLLASAVMLSRLRHRHRAASRVRFLCLDPCHAFRLGPSVS